jgi:hypothetical protein
MVLAVYAIGELLRVVRPKNVSTLFVADCAIREYAFVIAFRRFRPDPACARGGRALAMFGQMVVMVFLCSASGPFASCSTAL